MLEFRKPLPGNASMYNLDSRQCFMSLMSSLFHIFELFKCVTYVSLSNHRELIWCTVDECEIVLTGAAAARRPRPDRVDRVPPRDTCAELRNPKMCSVVGSPSGRAYAHENCDGVSLVRSILLSEPRKRCCGKYGLSGFFTGEEINY